ncbi:DUF6924 domain-containing protein [Streptomyces sp. Ru62]|uniref:DUF6924 domain-containing protein n=1 Tax=Streptomyces sp. Ru62 TaxID=2080745 RepID=UPI0015E48E77|nr:hypothetical protein [Streptomyces sp. Ru62]
MRTRNGIDARNDFDALVVRTDFDDPEAWRAVREGVATDAADGRGSRETSACPP